MILKLVRTPCIYLLGFMGSGKSTVGRLLADRLGWDFFDLDDDIEQAAGKTISEIFEQEGEAHFREVEREALNRRIRMVQASHAMVLALGGGACIGESCMERLSNNGVTVFIDCEFDTLAERVAQFDHRPLAKNPEHFRKLYEQRRPSYMLADHRVDSTNCTPPDVIEAIVALGIF
jgi:shikimate kinase